MLKLTWIEFFLICIPESFIIIWGMCVISKQYLNKLRYIICSILLSLVIFSVRLLPIHFGIHTIITNVFIVCEVIIAGIPLIKSIYSVFLLTLLVSSSDLISLVLVNMCNINVDFLSKSPLLKSILELPSLIFCILSILLIKFLLNKREGVRSVSN